MAKKAQRGRSKAEDAEPLLSIEVKKSIFAIALMALAAVIALAFFGLAGVVGQTIDQWLAIGLGASRIVAPFLLLIIGADLFRQDKHLITFRGAISFFLFLLGLDGVLNLVFVGTSTSIYEVQKAGGMFGLVISQFLAQAMGFWAALIVALALFLVSIVVLLNTSITQLAGAPLRLFRSAPPDEDEDEDGVADGEAEEETEEEAGEEEESTEEEGTEQETEAKPSKASKIFALMGGNNKEEQVMTTSVRRAIDVPLDLLDNKRSEPKAGDTNRNQEIISRTLQQFGIDVEMSDVRIGPTVTQYAFRPSQGVKLARIVALQNDLALALAAHPIRIEAPIPGKSLVGVEVPNQSVARVGLRELMESKEFKTRKSNFFVPLGKDITGTTQMLAIDKAPHMLVAGATGSGKSVCLNDIILSLLYQNGPDELKLIMVDPKRVELGVYAGIPHLLVPPIVKADEAVNALKWAVREMERRLEFLAKFSARDIDSYNAKSQERMPRIVIIIDELADLMIQNKREVEAVIVRIAQMARAAGIHLVLATQRPSVDVITGTIKANIPTRLAFAVASQVDSKTILDTAGADKLLGRGDMLMSTPELSKPRRVQCAYVSDVEIEKVVNFLKKENEPDYNYQITEGSNGAGGTAFNSADADPLLDEAIQIAIEAGRVSTSYLQRRMKIGYSRAARIVDLMHELGAVSEADGAKPREVLVTEWPPAGSGPDEDFDDEAEEDETEDVAEAVEELDDEAADAIIEEADPDEELTIDDVEEDADEESDEDKEKE